MTAILLYKGAYWVACIFVGANALCGYEEGYRG